MSGLVLLLPSAPTRKVWVGGTCGAFFAVVLTAQTATSLLDALRTLKIACSDDQGSTVLMGIGCLYPMGVAKNLALIFIELHIML